MVGGCPGFVFFSGPFDFAPGDTQWIMIALVPGLGNDCFDSITKMREKCSKIHSLPYDSLAFRKSSIAKVASEKPSPEQNFRLHQNFPNPFNLNTEIRYQLLEATHVKLEIYNLLGQKIRTLIDGQKPAGSHTVRWDGRDETGAAVSSGVYLYTLTAARFCETRKMVLMR